MLIKAERKINTAYYCFIIIAIITDSGKNHQ